MKKLLMILVLLTVPTWLMAADVDGDTNTVNDALDISKGGTDATTAAAARTNLGVGTTDNPSFASVHASGGNLAAANTQVTKKWITGLQYTADVTSVIHLGYHFICISTHTAGSLTEPGVGANWTEAWKQAEPAITSIGFNGVLTTEDNTIQEVAQRVDDLVAATLTIADSGSNFTATNVETALAEVADELDGLPTLTWGTGLTDTSSTISVTYPVTAEAFSTTGWNSDTQGLTRNDAYDYLHQHDSNDDGKVDTIDSGTGPTVDSAGEVAVDTTSDQLILYGAAKRVVSYKRQENFAVKTPVDADDFLVFKAQQAITITDIHVIAQGGTSIAVDVQECDSAGANCATVDAAITADTDGAEDDGTLSNGAIDAGDWVKVVLAAPSGTVNYLAGSIYYTITAD